MNPGGEDPRSAEAVEYVVGTLSARQREAFEDAMARDPALAALVHDWQERLVPLASLAGELEPSPGLRTGIEQRLGSPADADGSERALEATVGGSDPVDLDEVRRLRRSRSRWRWTAAGSAALAACLAMVVATEVLRRPLPSRGPLLAAVNRSGDLPALIIRVEPETGIVTVRSLAAETPSGRSLELWSILPGATPRTLGTLDTGAARVPVREQDRGGLLGATLAVTVEPSGGSPDGTPTGPVVYSGKLVLEPR